MSNDACSSYNRIYLEKCLRQKPKIKFIREKRRINPNKTCSGSVVEGFIWLYTGDRFRQREICMTEWGILEEGAHKQRYCIYTHTCP